ncbi:MAG: BCCT family transporter [Solobacterium sp.]|nr:BCCT family transporter [Solobacterium sp.]
MKNNKLNQVAIISLIIVGVLAVWAVALNESFTTFSNAAFAFLTTDFAWLYLLAVVVFVGFCLIIALGKWGNIKLGPDDAVPEYSNTSWFAMLFGAGMGVGLVFWGVSEPLSHFLNPAEGIESMTEEAADFAMKSSFMHWGIEPWACYAIIGLGLAYFQFRKNKPGLLSSVLEPLVGEKLTKGWFGKLVDILAVFATVAGVVTSIGLGVLQVSGGLNHLFGIPKTMVIQIAIIIGFAVVYIWTAVSGVEKGIKMLGDINLFIAVSMMIVFFVLGPRLEMLNSFTNGLGAYLNDFMKDSFRIHTYGDNSWYGSWRVFYWAWFIAWAPFVGIFIARISKGRTIREFIIGVMVAPALASFVWFAIFGTLGISLGMNGTFTREVLEGVVSTPEVGLFVVLEQYPLGKILSVIMLVLLCTFFITSANTGVFTLSMLTSDGDLNPPNNKKIMWGIIQSVMAIGLLMAGGLKPLQTISLVAAFPFIFIMLMCMVSFVKALGSEKKDTESIKKLEDK